MASLWLQRPQKVFATPIHFIKTYPKLKIGILYLWPRLSPDDLGGHSNLPTLILDFTFKYTADLAAFFKHFVRICR